MRSQVLRLPVINAVGGCSIGGSTGSAWMVVVKWMNMEVIASNSCNRRTKMGDLVICDATDSRGPISYLNAMARLMNLEVTTPRRSVIVQILLSPILQRHNL